MQIFALSIKADTTLILFMSSEGRTNGLGEKRGHLMQTRHGRMCAVLVTDGGKVNRTGVLHISIADGAS